MDRVLDSGGSGSHALHETPDLAGGPSHFFSTTPPNPMGRPRAARGYGRLIERRSLLAQACRMVGADRAYDAEGGLRPDVAEAYRGLRVAVIEEAMASEVSEDAALWARRGWPRDPKLADVPTERHATWVRAYEVEARRRGLSPAGPTGNTARRLALAILSLETGDPIAIQHVMDLSREERLEDAFGVLSAGGTRTREALRQAMYDARREGRINVADVDATNGGDADGEAPETQAAREAGCRDLFRDPLVVVTQRELDERFRRQRQRWGALRSRRRGDGGHGSVGETGAEDQS